MDAMLDLAKMAAEELHPDLGPHLYESDLGTCLKHPLVFQVPHTMNGMANRAYEYKTQAVAKALEEQDWHTYVFLHERPYRFEALMHLDQEGLLDDAEDRWKLVRDVWIDSENIWQHYDEWYDVLSSAGASLMMLDEEAAALAALPDVVTIYRGAKLEINEDGLSWTLDHDRGMWFAKRFYDKDEPAVNIHATVQRENIVALLTGRSENEVIVLPENVHVEYYEEI